MKRLDPITAKSLAGALILITLYAELYAKPLNFPHQDSNDII
jgi:hypothetical protein